MLRSLTLIRAKIAIFAASVLFGGVAWIAADIVSSMRTVYNAPDFQLKSIEFNDAKFDGEFTLFAETEKPVDLGFVKEGDLFLLSQNGTIVKSSAIGGKQRRVSEYFTIETENFLESGGCTAIAFHPDFSTKHTRGYGKFFVALTEKKGAGKTFEQVDGETYQEVIYEFSTDDHLAANFKGTRREILRVSNLPDVTGTVITDLTFDHKGHLYVGVADSSDTSRSRASDLFSVYGKVLRIDPLIDSKTKAPYRIPSSNPFFLVKNSLPELWSYGLRNPHTVAYDPFREWVCISDTGLDMLEEINVSHFGAEFFGWNLSEGSFYYPPARMNQVGEEIFSPQIEYARSSKIGKNVGGMIYRGERFPFLDGKAVFADDSGQILVAEVTPSQSTTRLSVLKPFGNMKGAVKSLKTGPEGEIFVFCEDGKVFELDKSRALLQHVHFHRALFASVSW
ncbi:MAG: PQQ-dependent sugar dehydrogenase [Verrucomicrobiales bacterium]|nr:PQQ-dependent sugar dehydrogenase [Verrucomicrobiales bacterium]